MDKYKVLWVDDREDIVDATKAHAFLYNLDLDWEPNWESAKPLLVEKFTSYSAIILDVYCKIQPGEMEAENKKFIDLILPQLKEIFAKKGRNIPWYLFSAKPMDDDVMETVKYNRQGVEDKWGEAFYNKSREDTKRLFETIKNVAEHPEFMALSLHKDVFNLVGAGRLIHGNDKNGESNDPRDRMLDMFKKLYSPEENEDFAFKLTVDSIRQMLEYFFNAACEYGLLAKECLNCNDFLSNSRKFMSGDVVKIQNDYLFYSEAIFSDDIKHTVTNLLFYATRVHHTNLRKSYTPYLTGERAKEEFFGYLFHLSHLIKWFWEYIKDNHSVTAVNSKKIIRSVDIVGNTYQIINLGDGPIIANYCKIDNQWSTHIGRDAKIESVVPNKGNDKDKYPLVANITLI